MPAHCHLWPILLMANKSCFYNIVFSNKIWNLQETKWMTCKLEARNSSSIQTRSSSVVPCLCRTGHRRPVQRHLCSLSLGGRPGLGQKNYAPQFPKLAFNSQFTPLLLIADTPKHTIMVLKVLYPDMIFFELADACTTCQKRAVAITCETRVHPQHYFTTNLSARNR